MFALILLIMSVFFGLKIAKRAREQFEEQHGLPGDVYDIINAKSRRIQRDYRWGIDIRRSYRDLMTVDKWLGMWRGGSCHQLANLDHPGLPEYGMRLRIGTPSTRVDYWIGRRFWVIVMIRWFDEKEVLNAQYGRIAKIREIQIRWENVERVMPPEEEGYEVTFPHCWDAMHWLRVKTAVLVSRNS